MLKQRPLQTIIIILPLIILLMMAGYFVNNAWGKYQVHKTFNGTLENARLLQQYETAVLNETLCKVLVQNKENKSSAICKDRIVKSKSLLDKLMQKDDSLVHFGQDIARIKKNSEKYKVDDFEKLLGSDTLDSVVKSYLDTTIYRTNLVEQKVLLDIYKRVSSSIYASQLEIFLVTYYVSNDEPVSTPNIIFWDKVVEGSYLFNLDEINNIPSVKEKLLNIVDSDDFQTLLSKIDDMRITILTGNMQKESKKLHWIVLLEKKLESLNSMQAIIYDRLYGETTKGMNHALLTLLLYFIIFVLAILSLLYMYFKTKKEQRESQALLKVVNRINTLSSYEKTEAKVMHKMLDDAKNKEDIFAYIYSSFQLLHEKQKQSKDEAESKSQFLSTLSHEIRTPLNGIIGFSKLLRDIGATQDQEEFLSLIEGSSHNLIAIVNDILDLSKIDADKMEIENASFNIVETVESTVATFTPQADQKDIELGVFIDPFLSNYFLGDATKLSQILTNLIGNAIKFTDTYGKINIFVQSLHNKKDETQIKFAVHDNGIGFSEEQRKNIFNAFSQATNNTSSDYGGTGLGLTISRQMVALMGGELAVESKPNNGSTFYFTITLKKDKTSEVKPLPDFSDVSVGLALPVKGIKRQLDTNLEVYMKHLGAKFSIHYYEDLFEGMGFVDLPDIMIFDHHYARLEGELEQCLSLDCKTVLLTNGTLRSRINPEKHHFNDILLRPIGLRKCIRILRNSREKVTAASASKKSTELANIESFEGLTALVADDNMINRKLIKIILEKIGLSVILSSDGKEAFDKYKNGDFDIIFMDIQMPVMDGIESTHKILEYEKEKNLTHVPIVALTANVAVGDKDKYLSEGMDDYATKPVEIDRLKALIAKHTEAS